METIAAIVRSRSRAVTHAWLLGWMLLPQCVHAQEHANIAVRVSWLSVEFLLRGDTAAGVEILAAATVAGRAAPIPRIDRMSLDPAQVVPWAQAMLPLVDSIDRLIRIQQYGAIGPPLPAVGGTGRLAIGYDPALKYGKDFFLFWDDSSTHRVWAIAAETTRIEALLDALAAVARRSGLHPSPPSPLDSGIAEDSVRIPPAMISHPPLRFPPGELALQREGQVWVTVVIDTTGRPEMASAQVLFSDGDAFTMETLRTLAQCRWRPARIGSKAVSVVVEMPFVFFLHR